jgi:acetyltransferase
MTVRNLEFLFRPKSVGVVAEPETPNPYAEVVLRNLAAGRFAGPVTSIAAKRHSLFGMKAHGSIEELESTPDLAVICAARRDVPRIIARLGERGTRAVIVGASTREKLSGSEVAQLRKAILDAARPQLMRVLGPGSGGLLVPASGLNASVAPVGAMRGKVALIAQSTAVASAVLDRANSKGIGFSSVLHLGASLDVDLADVLDWLAADPDTEAILVQFDAVAVGRKFMSAARAAARNKPVVAIRGRSVGTGRSADRLFSSDEVYEAALRRAGWVRIDTLEDLFDAVEAMARVRPSFGERLSIVANGHGLGRIAADALLRSGGRLAALSKDTVTQLDALLQTGSPLRNPLALPADVTPSNWAAALAVLLADRESDAVLTICSPSPFAPGAEVAAAVCNTARDTQRNVFTCWVGGSAMQKAQQIAAAHGVLSHNSPEKAIAIFLGIVDYVRNRELLMQMPASVAADFSPDREAARSALAEAVAAGTDILPARLARRLLHAYGIGAADYPLARSIDAAVRAADEIGYPVDFALALAGADEHEAMATALRSPADIRIAARALRSRVRAEHLRGRVSGYRLRPSAARSGIAALRLGVAEDPVFGPVIFLGPSAAAGRRGAGLLTALPPLNPALAMDLVRRSGFAEAAAADQRAALESATVTALVRLSQLLIDVDEIAAVELNPLQVEIAGVLALDVSIRIAKRGRRFGFRRFAIRPYPTELERQVDWDGGKLLIRPIRPEDESSLGDLLNSLVPEDARMRFFGTMRSLPRSQLARFTQIDYEREMALVAIGSGSDGVARSLGEVRAVVDSDNNVADFAVVVRSELKGKGLGRLLLQSMIDYSRGRGMRELRGETLAGNLRMQQLARSLGFTLKTGADAGTVNLHLALHQQRAA